MRCFRLLPVLITAALVTVGCADEPSSEPSPVKVAFDDGWGPKSYCCLNHRMFSMTSGSVFVG